MEPDWGPARSPDASRLWAEVMPPLAARLRAESHGISVVMMERIGAELPELVADPDDAETNRASNEANLLLVADLLERGADPQAIELPAPTLAYARVGAHQNTPLVGLMRAYRIGHGSAWRRILAILREQIDDPDEFAEAVDLTSAWLHEYVDAAACLADEEYNRQRDLWVRTTSALQAETIKAILDGTPIDPAAASARLGYELGRSHLAVVAWLDAAEQVPDPLAALESAVRRLTATAGFDRPLLHPTGLVTAAAWVGSHEPIDDDVLAATGPSDEEAAVRVGIGQPGDGVEGFRRSHREAMEARRVGMLAGRPPGSVTRYREVALAAMATADLEQARNFTERQLGPLAAGDETSTRLRATLLAYLDEGASHGRAANRLGIHENTVRYRVRQAEDLLERSVGSADLDFRVALALAATRGSEP